MAYIITIQYPYQHIDITISHDTKILTTETVSKFQAVSRLLPTLQTMLNDNNLTLQDISCIGVNVGPGPFNTLRSMIATTNGIAFAQKINLVACNGLDLLLQESSYPTQVAILDACGNDIYYAIKSSGKQGYDSIENLVSMLNNTHEKETIEFIGNGLAKHKDFIEQSFIGAAQFQQDIVFASPQQLINATYAKNKAGQTSREIFPLYFESPVIKQ